MRFLKLFSISILLFGLLSGLSPAETLDEADKLKIFSDACLKRWMEDAPANQDATVIKAVGEKFCTCAGKRIITILENAKLSPAEIEAAKKEASHACLMDAVLRESSSSFTVKNNVSDQKLQVACNNVWLAVFPKGMTDAQKAYTSNFCHCAATPLANLANEKAKLTGAQYDDKITNIVTTCKK